MEIDTSADFTRYFNVTASVLSAIFMGLILWRDLHDDSYDYWGRLKKINGFQKTTRYVTVAIFLYLAYRSWYAIKHDLPADLSTAVLAGILTAGVVGTVGWYVTMKLTQKRNLLSIQASRDGDEVAKRKEDNVRREQRESDARPSGNPEAFGSSEERRG